MRLESRESWARLGRPTAALQLILVLTLVLHSLDSVAALNSGNSSVPVYSYLLAENVLNNYIDVFPICSAGSVVQVQMDLGLIQLIGVNAQQQNIEINLHMELQWVDCNIHWNATEYNINSIEMLASKTLWLPDLSWTQRVGDGISDTITKTRARVYSNGTVLMSAQLVVQSFCSQNIRYYPFDAQSCNMTFSSALHDESELNLTNMNPSGDLTNFAGSGEWDILSFTAIRVDAPLFSSMPTAQVIYTLRMQRKPLFYLFFLVFPVMLISVISIMVFLLPPQSGEKVTLSITVLLSLTVYMLLIAETMPEQSEYIPLLGMYFAAMIALVTLSCILSVYIVNLHFRAESGEDVSEWVRENIIERFGSFIQCSSKKKFENALDQLGMDAEESEGSIKEEEFMDDWMRLARVVDRLCLIVFGITVVAVTVALAVIAYVNYYNPPPPED